MKRVNLLLLVIILLAAVLRLWNLGGVPSSPDWDEAALGYNAYSIMQTGKDEYSKFLPVVLRSFDDYKPALYAYLTIPAIALFDLNVFAVRLPSAIFGILTVLAVYFLVKELFSGNKSSSHQVIKSKDEKNGTEDFKTLRLYDSILPMLAAFLLAISPWHIQFSRIAFETNVGLAFNIFAALFFLKGLKKPWLLSLSVISMVLSIYVYQSEKVFVPLFALILVLIYRKELFSLPKKNIFISVILGIILIAPMAFNILTDKNTLMRARGVSVFAEPTSILRYEQKNLLDHKNKNDALGEIVHNRRVIYFRQVISGYLFHYDLKWLFIKGDLNRHHAPGMGLLYIWELPFLLIGIYLLLFGNFPKKTKLFILLWFLIAPIPAAATTGVPHAVRTLNFLPTWQIFTAIGIITTYQWLIKYQVSRIRYMGLQLLAICYLLFAIFNFIYYLNQYFVQQNYYYARFWQYGYEELVNYLEGINKNYDKIVVSNSGEMDQSYIFFVFYTKYDPSKYQKENSSVTGGFADNGHKFSNYQFHPFDYWKEKTPRSLFVGTSQDFPEEYIVIKKIYYPDGSLAYKVVEPK